MAKRDHTDAGNGGGAQEDDRGVRDPGGFAPTGDGDGGGGGAVDGLGQRLRDAEPGLEERNERYLRLAADFENFKRRKILELEERSRYANEDAARELLPVLDNLERALAHLPAGADDAVTDGLSMVVRSFEAALERLGVTPILTAGQLFDPALHEAVMAEDSADVDQDMVAQELQKGYRLHDRVVRPAMVKVVHPAQGAAGARNDEQV